MSTPKKEKVYTIEEIDKLLVQAPKARAGALTAVPKHLAGKSTLQLSNIIVKICGIVSQATPILNFVKRVLFFRPKWVKFIDEVIAISEIACPPSALKNAA